MGNFCSGIWDSSHQINKVEDLNSESRENRILSAKENENLDRIPVEEKKDEDSDKGFKNKLKDFNDKALKRHNHYRKKHGVTELKLNQNLCEISQKFAEEIAKNKEIFHSNSQWKNHNLGECMVIMYGKELSGEEMTDIWYSEKSNYDFAKPTYKENSGYFSQIVWKSSEEVGFGLAKGENDKWVGIANYYPSGNVIGDYENNVYPETS